MRLLKGHEKEVNSIAFTPDGGSLASCSANDRTVRLWDLNDGSCRLLWRWDGSGDYFQCESLCIRPDGSELAAVGNGIRLFALAGSKQDGLHRPFGAWLQKVAYSPDGRWLVTVSPPRLTIWEADGLLLDSEKVARSREWDFCIAFSPDGLLVAASRSHEARPGEMEYRIDWLELQSLAPRKTLREPARGAHALRFSPDGRLFVAACGPKLFVWDVASHRLLFQRAIGTRIIQSLAFTPDGRHLLSAHNDQAVRIWNAESWQMRTEFTWKVGKALDVAVAPDGLRAAVSGSSGKIVV